MFMRPVKGASLPRTRAATAKYDPVWVTCDDLAAEGILVSRAAASLPHSACQLLQTHQSRPGLPSVAC
jgi:hypothetical protein